MRAPRALVIGIAVLAVALLGALATTAALRHTHGHPALPTTPLRPTAQNLHSCDRLAHAQAVACLENHLERMAKVDPLAMLDVLNAYQSQHVVRFDCHGTMHLVGRAHWHTDIRAVLARPNGSCTSPLMHGIMQGRLGHVAPAQVTPALLHQFEVGCAHPRISARQSCVHGIGHGVMRSARDNRDVALAKCGLLGGASAVVCSGGVFMEAHIDVPGETRHLTARDASCTGVPDALAGSCWSWIARTSPLARQPGICAGAPAVARDFCYWHVGLDSGDSVRDGVHLCAAVEQCWLGHGFIVAFRLQQGALDYCSRDVPAGERAACTRGAARGWAFGQEDVTPAQGAAFCARALAALRPACAQGFAERAAAT